MPALPSSCLNEIDLGLKERALDPLRQDPGLLERRAEFFRRSRRLGPGYSARKSGRSVRRHNCCGIYVLGGSWTERYHSRMMGRGFLESIDCASDAVVVVGESGTILFANHLVGHLLGYAPGELQGQSVERLMPERFRMQHIGHRLRFTDDRRTRPMGAGLELFALCKDGSERRVEISLNPVQRGLETVVVAVIRQAHVPASAP